MIELATFEISYGSNSVSVERITRRKYSSMKELKRTVRTGRMYNDSTIRVEDENENVLMMQKCKSAKWESLKPINFEEN